MTRSTHRTQVAGVTLDLPMYRDAETTEKLAQEVTQRIREIEETSQRIDTQAFALAAAVSFAAELADAREEHRRDSADAAKSLTVILARLDEIIQSFADAGLQ